MANVVISCKIGSDRFYSAKIVVCGQNCCVKAKFLCQIVHRNILIGMFVKQLMTSIYGQQGGGEGSRLDRGRRRRLGTDTAIYQSN